MKKAILVLQMGGPCCVSGIQPFLYNLFSDPFIIQLPFFLKPFQKTLATFISKRRAPKVAVNYEEIGGRSPILYETQHQAKSLEDELNRIDAENEYKCFIAMRYSYPFLKDNFEEIKAGNFDSLTVLPLYPQYSVATTGSSFWECEQFFKDFKIPVNYIESWETNDYFTELIKNNIEAKLPEFATTDKVKLLFSAHGLPQKYIDDGDPYQKQIHASCEAIVAKLSKEALDKLDWQISYQSRVGPVKWLEPNTEDVLQELGKDGVKNVLIVPISFVGDHIETLHELGIEYREVAEEAGIENYHITELPKSNPLLIKALASCIDSKLYEKVAA